MSLKLIYLASFLKITKYNGYTSQKIREVLFYQYKLMNLLGLTEKMSNFIIRPPRSNYEIRQLGSPVFSVGQIHFIRQDFRVNNYRGQELVGSYFKPYNYTIARPTIVFLHGNSSSRVSVRAYLQQFLPNFNLVSFDFAGSGQSQGNYTTLGYQEKQDVQAILSFLISEFNITQVILWGRSMGAVTAILYAAKHYKNSKYISSNMQFYSLKPSSRNINIKALILDSPFSDLQKLMKQKGGEMFPYLPNFLIEMQIDQIQRYIENTIWEIQKTNFNLKRLKPKEDIKKIDPMIPLFFITARNDKIIDYHHTIELYREANSLTKKQIEIINGGHNDMRPSQTLKTILNFLIELTGITQKKKNHNMSFQDVEEKSCSSKESQYLNLSNKAYFLKIKLKRQKDQAKVAQKNCHTKLISRVIQYQNKQRPRKKGISLLTNPNQILNQSTQITLPKEIADETTSVQSCKQLAPSLNFNKVQNQNMRSNMLDYNQVKLKKRYLNKINQEVNWSKNKRKSTDLYHGQQPLNLRNLIRPNHQNPNSSHHNYIKNLEISSSSCKNLTSSYQKSFKYQYPNFKNQSSHPKVKSSFKDKKLAIINPHMYQSKDIPYKGYTNRPDSNLSIHNNTDSFCSIDQEKNKKINSNYKVLSDFPKYSNHKQMGSKLHHSYKQLCSTLQSSYKIQSKGQNSMIQSQQIY